MVLFCSTSLSAQSGFALEKGKKKDKIQFRLVNNLPIVSVEINGTLLSFILDTGVKNTILFSLEEADSVQLRNTTHIELQGLGAGSAIGALKSLNNRIKVGNAVDSNHTLYVIFGTALNFSPRMGIPIHGILGNDFFQNFIAKMNYGSEKITLYDPQKYSLKKCRKCIELPLHFVNGKPYISIFTNSDTKEQEATLLVDSGSSDVLWLFDSKDFIVENPKNYFNDFLGLGLSGDIFGKRARIAGVTLGNYHLNNVNTSFPEEDAISKARNYVDRDGSVGGGFLSRFTITLDYGNSKIRFRKNRKFREPFNYNMSGLTIEHEGVELVKHEKQANVKSDEFNKNQNLTQNSISVTTEFQFSLVPKYVVVDVRKGSPADIAGIQINDEIISVNGKPAYDYKLYDLITMFSHNEGRKITMKIKKGNYINNVKFELKSVF